MVNLIDSPNLHDAFSLLFKARDVKGKIESLVKYIKSNLSTVNASAFRPIGGVRGLVYDSKFSIFQDNVRFNIDDDKSILKCILVYFYHVDPSLLKKTAYKPESFFITDNWREHLEKWRKYIDMTMNEYLVDNKDVGCTYTEKEIKNHYPGQSDIRLITLYRVCNSQGRLVPLQEFLSSEIKGFDIKTDDAGPTIVEGLGGNDLFKECLVAFKDYVKLNSSKAGLEKIKVNQRYFSVYLDSLNSNNDLKNISDNPLVLAKFMLDFDNLTSSTVGFAANIDAIKKLDVNFKAFCEKVFNLKTRLNEDKLFINMPKNSVVEVLGQPISIGNYIRSSKIPPPVSNSSSLPEHIDELVSKAMCDFMSQFGEFESKFVLDGLLFVFGKLTTNEKFWRSDKLVSFSIDKKPISFRACDFRSYLIGSVKSRDVLFNCDNIIRQWANHRGNRAMRLFKVSDFKPGLFSTVPNILPWMRFDFFKLLSSDYLDDDEIKSLRTLRLMTEHKSNKTKADEHRFTTWISQRL
nr:MAG: 59 kDa protein [Cucurbit yellow stunting disorder virus]